MRIEKGKDKIIFLSGFILAVVLVILINIFITKANYRKTESIPLAKGTINYSLADLNIIAMYKEKDEYLSDNDKYEIIEQIPGDGYMISDESYCTEPNSEEQIKNNMTYKNGIVSVDITKKGTKCYIYFEKEKTPSGKTLAKLEVTESKEGCPEVIDGETIITGIEKTHQLICSAEDNDGISYYYRGAVTNNWVKFGTNDTKTKDIWWRIVRINGDGTIRLIYSGMLDKNTKPSNPNFETETETVVALVPFASSSLYADNTYVGYYYGTEGGTYPTNHSNATAGNVAAQLKLWYNGVDWDAVAYGQYIDQNAGFCNDRTIHPTAKTWWTSEGSSGRGAGNIATAYGSFSRLKTTTADWNTTQTPTLICGKDPSKEGVSESDYKRDLYTPKNASKGNVVLEVPVGLITADEVVFAGGGGNVNQSYYLYNNQHIWTMSPCYFNNGFAQMFYVHEAGHLTTANTKATTLGIRPVINLRADVKIQVNDGNNKGTIDNPYIVG